MDDLYQLVLERNNRETNPFLSIHVANATLLNQIDALQAKCAYLERELVIQTERLQNDSSASGGRGAVPHSVALKEETRLREKLEKLQEELDEKLKASAEEQASIFELTKELSDVKDLNVAQESTISNLTAENERQERSIDHMTTELTDAKSRTKLAEQQYVGLKDTIRVLQEENDLIKKENQELSTRFVTEKESLSDEMNKLTEMVEKYKREVQILHGLKEQDDKRKSWFGLGSKGGQNIPEKSDATVDNDARKFGSMSVVVPTSPKQMVQAHKGEASCVRYDASGMDLVATGGADSTVQVWDTSNASLKATLRGGSSNSIISCDISNGVVIGGGSDKTCRVWNLRTGRMVRNAACLWLQFCACTSFNSFADLLFTIGRFIT
jgi:autophagy-related protein 16